MKNIYTFSTALFFVLFSITIYSQGTTPPCDCFQRWEEGAHWRPDGTVNDAPNAPVELGVIRCGSSAETQSNIDPVNGCTYDPTEFEIDVSGSDCVDPSSGNIVNVLNPTPGQPIIWLNFDVRPNAGNFQIQINDNSGDNIGWALYVSMEHTSSVTWEPSAGDSLSGFTGDCTDMEFMFVTCGQESSNTWNTIPVDMCDFSVPTNFYLAIWDQDADGNLNINNFKARFGCGDDPNFCTLVVDEETVACNNDGTYTLTIPFNGVNGQYTATDPNALTISSDVCLGNISDGGSTSGIFTLIYNIGTDYNVDISLVDPATINGCADDQTNPDECSEIINGTSPSLPTVICNDGSVECAGDTDGEVSVVASGGSGIFTYLWDANAGNQTTATATGLGAGTYTVTVTGEYGCESICTASVTTADILEVICSTNHSGNLLDCNGDTDGEVSVTPGGGTPGYTYNWENNNNPGTSIGTGASVSDLGIGTYNVTVTDANFCTATCSITLTEPDPVTTTCSSNYTNNLLDCNGDIDGEVSVTPGGGTPGYSYNWENNANQGVSIGTGASVAGLGAGTYNATVTDANLCTATCSITLTEPTPVTADCSSNHINNLLDCNGDIDGEVSVTPGGGTPGYSYNWENNANQGVSIGTGASVAGLGAGTYNATVTDANLCTATCSITLIEPTPVTADCSSNHINNLLDCNGDTDGEVSVTPGGGTPGYSYNWENNNNPGTSIGTGASVSGLGIGTYNVTVTDANFCTATCSITLTEPDPVTTTCSSNHTNNLLDCNGDIDGEVSVTPGGGTPGYSYNWENNNNQGVSIGTGASVAGLGAGTYNATVTDANLCTATCSITLTEPTPVTADCSSNHINNLLDCNGDTDGEVSVTPGGGTPEYSYNWENNNNPGTSIGTGASVSGLGIGTYNVTVTDANFCTATCSIILTEPDPVAATCSSNHTNNLLDCNGDTDGEVSVTPDGGTPGYSYNWENNNNPGTSIGTSASVSGLGIGTYNVTVTDANFCTATCSITLTEPSLLICSAEVTSDYEGQDISCAGNDGEATASGSGGTLPYSYQWDANAGNQTAATATGLSAGTYFVTITDNNNCMCVTSVTLIAPTCTLSVTKNAVDVDGDGTGDGPADEAGDVITYDILVTNTGNLTLTGVNVDDPITGTLNAMCGSGTLAPAQSCTVTVIYIVTQTDIDNYGGGDGDIDNTATGQSNETPDDTDSEEVPLTHSPDILIIKTGSLDIGPDGIATPGDIINYTLTVTNTGNVTLSNVDISDPLPGIFIGPLSDIAGNGFDVLAPGDSETANANYAITQSDIDAGFVFNTATTTGDCPDGTQDCASDDDDHNEPIPDSPDILIIKTGSLDIGPDGIATPGDIINYTLTVTNTGNVTLSNVDISDPLPGIFIGSLSDIAGDGIDVLAPGDGETANANYTITQADIDAGFVFNTATTTGDCPDGTQDCASDDDDHNEPIPDSPDILIIKTGSLDIGPDGIATPGDIINYTLTLTNTGNVTLSNVDISDPLPGIFIGPLSDIAGDGFDVLAPGDSETANANYTITQTDIDAGFVFNTATTTGDCPDGTQDCASDDDIHIEPISQNPELVVSKTAVEIDIAGNGIIDAANEIITYEIVVTNVGNLTLTNVSVDDDLTSTFNLPCAANLAPGASCMVSATYTVTQADIDNFGANPTGNGFIDNTAIGYSDQTDPVDDSEQVPVIQDPSMIIDKLVIDVGGDGPAGFANIVGEVITYDIILTNNGNQTLTNVTLDDDLTGTFALPCAASLAPGASCTVTVTYTVTQADIDNFGANPPGNGFIDNTAIGYSDQTDPVDDSEQVPVIQDPSMIIDKLVIDVGGDGPAGFANIVGEVITYDIILTNNGNQTLTNVTLDDDLTSTFGLPCAASLTPGASCTVTVTHTVTQADIDNFGANPTGNGFIDNTAIGYSDQTDPVDDSEQVPVIQDPSMIIDKLVLDVGGDGPAGFANIVGEVITYDIILTNNGNQTLTNVTLDDDLTGTFALPCAASLTPGASCTVTVTYTVTQADIDNFGANPPGNGFIDNTAIGNSDQTDPVDDSEQVPVIQDPSMIIDKLVIDVGGDGPAGFANIVGEVITYDIILTNNGNQTLTNVTLDDDLTGTFALPCAASLAPGASCTVTVTYTVTQADIDNYGANPTGNGFIDNTAIGYSDQTDPVDDSEQVPVIQDPSMIIDKLVLDVGGDGPAGFANIVGEVITYDIILTNNGNQTLTNVTLDDDLTGTFALPCAASLTPGASCTVTVTYTVTQADIDNFGANPPGNGFIDNTAIGYSDQTDPVDDSEQVPVIQDPSMIIDKLVIDVGGDGPAGFANIVGEVITYDIILTNNGNQTLTNVTLDDDLTGTFALPCAASLAPGASCTVTVTYTVTQNDIDTNGGGDGNIDNTATGNSDQTQPVNDAEQVPVEHNPRIGISKLITSGVTNNGDGTYTLSYHIKVENVGNTTLDNVQVNDDLTNTFALANGFSVDSYGIITQPSGTTITTNSGYDGGITSSELLDGLGSLLIGNHAVIQITLTVTPGSFLGPYNNSAFASGESSAGEGDDDMSDVGSNATDDPATGGDNPDDPDDLGTCDDPTPVVFVENPQINLMKTVSQQPISIGGGAYFLAFEIRVENTGDVDLHDIQVEDDMSITFAGVDSWFVNSHAVTIQPVSTTLLINPGYTGESDIELLDGMGYIKVGEFAIIEIQMIVSPGDFLGPYFNVAYGVGTSPTDNEVDDMSNFDVDIEETPIEFPPNGQISDFVWEDFNGDGIQDPGEPGIDDVTVNLFDDFGNLIMTTMTSGGGMYLFDDVEPNNYYVEFIAPDGMDLTSPGEGADLDLDSDPDDSNGPGTTPIIVLMNGDTLTNIDAGFYFCIPVGELVWYDMDMDDVWDDVENGINGLDVNIYRYVNGEWIFWDSNVTGHKPGTPSDDGYYIFCVPPGEYYIEIPISPFFELVPVLPFIGDDPFRDSHIDDSNGPFTSPTLTLQSGEVRLDIGAGFYPMAMMGDYIWNDVNVNGIQDNGEDFFAGVTVQVYNEYGAMVDEDVSDIHGRFEMDYLQKKNYYLKVYPPEGFGFTAPNQGNDDEMDSDVDGSNGHSTTPFYLMSPGIGLLNVDVGLVEGALPLDLIFFSGENVGEENHLFWKTTNELNVEKFVIERSTDNFEFSDMGTVKTLVNNSAEKDYAIIDENIEPGVLYYYRLRIIDLDASYEFSNIISLISEKKRNFSAKVYPIPTDQRVNIAMSNLFETEVQINVYYVNNSRVIETDRVEIAANNSGEHMITMDFGDYTPGIYILEIKAGNDSIRKRIIVVQ